MELNDNQLKQVSGGMTDQEIIDSINNKYSQLPQDIRNKIIEALNKYGKKDAQNLAEKLIKNYEWAKSLLDLFK